MNGKFCAAVYCGVEERRGMDQMRLAAAAADNNNSRHDRNHCRCAVATPRRTALIVPPFIQLNPLSDRRRPAPPLTLLPCQNHHPAAPSRSASTRWRREFAVIKLVDAFSSRGATPSEYVPRQYVTCRLQSQAGPVGRLVLTAGTHAIKHPSRN